MYTHFAVLSLSCLATLAPVQAVEVVPQTDSVQTAVSKAALTMARAIEIATDQVAGGFVYRAELLLEEGRPQFEITLLAGT